MQYLQDLNLIAMNDFGHYKPVSCDFYDLLTHYVSKKSVVEINVNSPYEPQVYSGIISDVFTKNKEEFCVIQGIELRLDYIISVLPTTLAS